MHGTGLLFYVIHFCYHALPKHTNEGNGSTTLFLVSILSSFFQALVLVLSTEQRLLNFDQVNRAIVTRTRQCI